MKNSQKFWDLVTRDFILDDIDEAICVVNLEGEVTVWNRKSESIYGVLKENIIGRKMDQVLQNTVIMEVLNTKKSIENIYNATITGCRTLVNGKIIYKDGEAIGALCVDKDLSELEKLKDQMENMKSHINFLELRDSVSNERGSVFVGGSEKIEELMYKASRVAKTDATIMVLGESGVGKKALAKRIHNMSNKEGIFVSVNCGAIPMELFEHEFFGYENKLTGESKPGFFELANKGTIYLGEIGEMPILAQSRLFNILQKMEVQRVGSEKSIPITTRIISATSKNIKTMVEEGNFLEDLYYALDVIELEVPALRERKEDISYLLDVFLQELSEKHQIELPTIEANVINMLLEYSWNGNLRELKNTVEHLLVMSNGKTIVMDSLPYSIKENTKNFIRTSNQINDLQKSVAEFESHIIEEALSKTHWNKSEAARILNIPRTTLIYKINQYDLKKSKTKNRKI